MERLPRGLITWEAGSKEGNGHHLNKITLDSYMGDFRNNRRTGKGRIIFGDGSISNQDPSVKTCLTEKGT